VLSTGRSGSTLLEMLLATHPEVTSLGELQLLPHLLREPEAQCQCGKTFPTCPMWGPLVSGPGARDALAAMTLFRESKDAGRVIRWRWLPELLAGRTGRRARAEASGYASFTFDAVTRATRLCGARVVVDTSKDPYRLHVLLAASAAGGIDIRVVQLVRDPRGFVASTIGAGRTGHSRTHPDRRAPSTARVVRVAARWLIQHLLFELLLADRAVLLVRYEDLACDPRSVLARIGAWLGVDPTGFDPPAFRTTPGHAVGGNPMRHRRDPIVLDERWRSDLRRWHATLVWWICAPLARRFGYRRLARRMPPP
jgi:hypothetical protein